jgi:CRP-like cAMP-binding protein
MAMKFTNRISGLAGRPCGFKMKHVATLGKGQAFGEVALQTNQPRSATIRTLEPTHFACLEREDYANVLKSYFEQKKENLIKFISTVPLFSTWSDDAKAKLCFLLIDRNIKKNDIVYDVGSPVLEVYIVKEGEFAVQRRVDLPDKSEGAETHPSGHQPAKREEWKTIGLLTAPQLFGFTAYIQGEKRHNERVICNTCEGSLYCILCNKFVSRLSQEIRTSLVQLSQQQDLFYENQQTVMRALANHAAVEACGKNRPALFCGRNANRYWPKPKTDGKGGKKKVADETIFTPGGRLQAIRTAFAPPEIEDEACGVLFKRLRIKAEDKKQRVAARVQKEKAAKARGKDNPEDAEPTIRLLGDGIC